VYLFSALSNKKYSGSKGRDMKDVVFEDLKFAGKEHLK
jgi:hypothetical protein